jgi:ATP-dependent DNA helicase RecG
VTGSTVLFTSIDELVKKIALGEDSEIEFKTVSFKKDKITAPHRNSVADEIAAFANGGSGIILFGVSDNKKITGIPADKLKILESFIRDICRDTITPPLFPKIIFIELPDAAGRLVPVVKVEISKSLYVHKSPNGYFTRLGSSKREMPPELLARMFQQRSQSRLVRFDESVVMTAKIEDLDKELWEKYKTPLSDDDDKVFLSKNRLIARGDDTTDYPTVCGLLIGSKNPHHHIYNAFIQAVCYRGKEKNAAYQIEAKDITGPVDKQIREACQFVYRNMKIYAEKSPARIDHPEYSMNAVFEAIVNAVAHRDYSITGSKIRLHMFGDRLEIYSPGTIPNTLDIDSMAERQFARNETLTSFLARSPFDVEHIATQRKYLMDKRGEGVPLILLESEKISGKRPVYTLLNDTELKLTIWPYVKEFPPE